MLPRTTLVDRCSFRFWSACTACSGQTQSVCGLSGTQMLQLVTVFIVYVSDSNHFFHFHDVESACFSFDIAWLYLSFLFCFSFFRPFCGIRWPTSSCRCVCHLFAVFRFASHYIGSRKVLIEQLIFAVIRLSVNWRLFSPFLLVSSLLGSILPI